MTKPTLNLFPDPGSPSTPPTWEDVERLALHYPSAHHAVTLVERGDMTKEQGLVALVYFFAKGFSGQFKRETDALALEIPERIVTEPCGCSESSYIRRRVVRMPCEQHRTVGAVDPHVG
jgi:hypothetical protein